MTATLTGRRALVTGGSRGIGAATVRRLVAINVRGVFAAIQRAVPHLGPGGGSSASAASMPIVSRCPGWPSTP